MFTKAVIVFLFCKAIVIFGEQRGSSHNDIIKVNEKELGEGIDLLYEGDIMSTHDAPIDKKRKRYWPNGIVAYTISSSFSNSKKQQIRNALADITEAAPCIIFKEYTSNPPNAYVQVFHGSGCWSMVGRTGRKQQLSIGTGCMWTGTIIHEFLHALGFYHEQSRPDRDNYIRINMQNVRSGREHNFRKASNVNSLGVKYDRQSVMHYSKNAFSNGKGPTIEWKANPNLRLGGRVLSPLDKLQLNLLYCDGTVKPTTKMTTTMTKPTTRIRTRPTKMTIKPTRPSKACGDMSGSCINVQFSPSCDQWQKINCPRSCGICKGPVTDKCLNMKDTWRSCRYLVKRGRCQSRDYKIRYKTKINCTRSCCNRNELYKFPRY